MSSDRYQQTKRILEQALDLPAAERASFLETTCRSDHALRREIDELLAHAESSSDFLDTDAIDDVPAPRSFVPETVGGYRIVRAIGEGGMGTVFEAVQETPHRRVALKVLRPGVGSESGIRRLQLEAEILGRLDHPGIARIFDAGTEDWGAGPQPFLVMEFVEGRSLAAASAGLDRRARLELIAQVADAVEHAHRKGIVHRDLKPENVMLDAGGDPRVLDFGIARAADPDLRTTYQLSSEGQLIGTLAYMSPEQAGGDSADVDSRSDVYALGAISYELVTGELPLELTGKPILEAVRMVREVEPRDPRRIDATVPPDLAAVLLKALAKEPERRYGGAAELAADLRAFLEHRPITARHTTALKKLELSFRRQPLKSALIALLVVATFALTALGTYVAATAPARATGERTLRRERAATALREGFLAVQVLDMAAARRRFDAGLALEPDNVELILGRAIAFADRADSIAWLDGVHETGTPPRALDRLRALLLEGDGKGAEAKLLNEALGAPVEAIDMLVAGWAHKERVPRTRTTLRAAVRLFRSAQMHARVPSFLTLAALSDTALDIGDLALASDAARALRRLWPDSPNGAVSVAAVLARQKKFAEGIALLREALEQAPNSPFVKLRLAALLGESGKLEEAIALANEVRAARPLLSRAHMILIPALAMSGDLEGAERVGRAALSLPGRLEEIHANLANVLIMRGDMKGAVEQFRRALALQPTHAVAHSGLRRALGRTGDAEGLRAELARWAKLHPTDARARAELARYYLDRTALGATADPEQALRHARASAAIARSVLGLTTIARALAMLGKTEEASGAAGEALAFAETEPGTPKRAVRALRRLVRDLRK